MTFTSGWALHFLWILPMAGFAMIVRHRRRRHAMERFAEPALLARLTLDDHKDRRFFKGVMLLFALGILIFALAGPRWGNRYQEVSRKGVDIMILVDVSHSMMVEDVDPNRLERARREIVDFLKVVEGDRVGLTAFSGAAFVQCPLTLDYAALEMFLNALEQGIIPVPGTDLNAAIQTGLSAFDFKTETDKVMLLITDGEDNEQRGLKAARDAAGQGVKIFVFGIGEPSGGPIPAGDGKGGFKKDKDGNLVLSRLDEKTLKDLAGATGGGYVRSVAGDLDLDMLYFEGIREKTEAQTLKSGKIKIYEERFNVFVLAGFILLLLEELLDGKRRPKSKKRFGFLVVTAVWGLIGLFLPNMVQAVETADELYRQGQYEAAEQAYAKEDMDHPKDLRYRYNRGCAAFQSGQWDKAAAAFSSVMKRTKDRDMRFKAAYNLGNTAFKQGDYESAAAHFMESLTTRPDSEKARYNLELALKTIEEMKQDPSDTPDESQESGDDKDKGEKGEKGEDDPESDGQSQDEDGQQGDEEKEDAQKDEGEKDSDDSDPGGQEPSGDNRNEASQQGEKPETENDDDLDGELSARQPMSELNEKKDTPGADHSTTDKKSAEALLDNVQENPSEIMRFMIPEKGRKGTASGRDW